MPRTIPKHLHNLVPDQVLVFPFDVHAQRGTAAAHLAAVRVGTARLGVHVHGHDVLAQVTLAIATLGAQVARPHAPTVLNYVAGHRRFYEGGNVWKKKKKNWWGE